MAYRRALFGLSPVFRDRVDAGAQLGECLVDYRGQDALVLGIPRGGIPVAVEVARRLDAELDVIVACKLGAPQQEELAIGAVTGDGGRLLNLDLVRETGVSEAYLARVTAEQQAEARRREERFRGRRTRRSATGRTVIVVDDGLATGATMHAAVHSIRRRGAGRVIVAIPVAPAQTCEALGLEADEVVCLVKPDPFFAVGLHYQDFSPTEEAEIEQLLRDWEASSPAALPMSDRVAPAEAYRETP